MKINVLYKIGLGDMSKNVYLCIFLADLRYVCRYFVFGLNR